VATRHAPEQTRTRDRVKEFGGPNLDDAARYDLGSPACAR
jgi:hypothetical protein